MCELANDMREGTSGVSMCVCLGLRECVGRPDEKCLAKKLLCVGVEAHATVWMLSDEVNECVEAVR